MTTIPTWLAATAGSGGNGGMVDQFLPTHNTTFLYSGAQIITSQSTGSGLYQSTQNQWMAQTFTTGNAQTAIGSVNLQLSTVGGSPTLPLIPVLTVSIYADSSGQPLGPALASATISNNYVYTSPFWVSIPMPLTVTPSTVYHIVTNLVGSTGHYYVWQQSNQTSGSATAPDGVTWSFQAYGLMYQILDQTSTGLVTAIAEDNGSKFTSISYTNLNQVSTVTEFVTAQASSYIQSSGTLSYTNGLLTGVS